MARPDLPVHQNQVPRLMPRDGLRLREDTLYSDHKGDERGSIRKNAEKALQKLAEPLQRLLEPDEAVLFITRVNMPVSAFEQLTFGWYLYRMSAATLVITNRRMLFFLVKYNGDWRKGVCSVRWGDIAELKVKGLFSRNMLMTYRNGKKEKYWNIAGREAKTIRLLAPLLLPESAGENSPAQGPVRLCPECFAALTERVYLCGGCGLVFKDEKTMVRRSLLIPGGGYFYCGQTFLGIGDCFAESILLVWTLMAGLAVLGLVDLAEPGEPPVVGAAAAFLLAFVLLIFAIEKWGTIHHCRRFIREFIPTREHAAGGPPRTAAAG